MCLTRFCVSIFQKDIIGINGKDTEVTPSNKVVLSLVYFLERLIRKMSVCPYKCGQNRGPWETF